MNEVDENIATNLKVAREAAGVSQEELARRLVKQGFDWSQTTVWKTESGQRPVRAAELVALAEAVGVPTASLTGIRAKLLPDRIAELHERVLQQEAVAQATHDAARRAEAELTRLVKQSNALFAQLPPGTGRLAIERMIGTEEEIAARQAARSREIRQQLDAAVDQLAVPQRTKRGGKRS